MNESQLQNLSDKEFCAYVEPDSDIAREAISRLSVNADIDADQIESLECALSEARNEVDELGADLEIANDNISFVIDELTEIVSKNPDVNVAKKLSEIISELRSAT